MGPFIQDVLFPFHRIRRASLGPILRMTVGFFISTGLAYAAGLESLIHSKVPCYKYPLGYPAAFENSGGTHRPNDVNMWLQTPLHFILAAREILITVALSEFAYTQGPAKSKSMIQAFQKLIGS